jgi:hypothetical protein
MSVPSSESRLTGEYIDRLRRLSLLTPQPTARQRFSISDGERKAIRRGEWTASPPGRIGRSLLVDLERYLDFFAIARS